MMSTTHAAIALAGTTLLLATADPLTLSLALLGSQLPDIDTSTSLIGQIAFPISSWLEDRYPHRSVTHSLLATTTIGFLSLATAYLLGHQTWIYLKPAIALPLGHFLSCLSDCFTKQGVQLFWPESAWCVSVSNPRRRLRSGGTGEHSVLVGAIVLLLIGLSLAQGGGLTQQLGQSLGLRDQAIETFNAHASTAQVWAEVDGTWASDRTSAKGRYLVIDASGSEFVVTDGQGVYRTGSNLITTKLVTQTGAPTRRLVQTAQLKDDDVAATLTKLQSVYPKASIWVSGSLVVDALQDVKPIVDLRQVETIALGAESNPSLTLTYCPLDQAINRLRGQYGTGTLSAVVFSPGL
jgi:inner membrane protein